jgi:hypothetical protein
MNRQEFQHAGSLGGWNLTRREERKEEISPCWQSINMPCLTQDSKTHREYEEDIWRRGLVLTGDCRRNLKHVLLLQPHPPLQSRDRTSELEEILVSTVVNLKLVFAVSLQR